MTYEGRQARASRRVMTALVVMTIIIVAIWAVGGGLEAIPVTEVDSALVSE